MDNTELKGKVAEAFFAYEKMKEEYENAKKAMICMCPVKVGDVIKIEKYEHKGKLMRINEIKVLHDYWDNTNTHRFYYCLVGTVLKKDGTNSSYDRHRYQISENDSITIK